MKFGKNHPVSLGRILAGGVAILACWAGLALGPARGAADKPSEEGFVSMFNGKDLAGWEGETQWWGVKNGCITAESTPAKLCKKQSYLMWRGGQPGDFEMRLNFRLVGGNSGIQIRSKEIANWDTRGYQADMDDACVWAGALFEHMRGGIAMRGQKVVIAEDGKKTTSSLGNPDALKAKIRRRDWNEYRIVCRGDEISLYINDTLMSQAKDDQQSLAARRGIIALQMHPGPPMKVEYKNLRIKEYK